MILVHFLQGIQKCSRNIINKYEKCHLDEPQKIQAKFKRNSSAIQAAMLSPWKATKPCFLSNEPQIQAQIQAVQIQAQIQAAWKFNIFDFSRKIDFISENCI